MRVNRSGQQFGDYYLIRRLGSGQFGDVYLAKPRRGTDLVALKILHESLDQSNIADFLSEARAFRIEHPNIVRIQDFGQEDGFAFLAMDYISNGNLRLRHSRGTHVLWDVVASYVSQITRALQVIHERGTVHRDVKPENLLVGADGRILLSDFGIAIPSYTWDPDRIQIPRGTPIYIAPEQINSMAVRESDQYSLGVVMYEWLTGSPPFTGSLDEVLIKQQLTTPAPIRDSVPTLHPQAEQLVLRMLAKQPEQRFGSMEELAYHLSLIPKSPKSLSFEIHRDRVFAEHAKPIRAVSWSPDGRYIASADNDALVLVWNAATGAVVHAYRGHKDTVWSLAWSPDSTALASASTDGTVQVWEATTGALRIVYFEHSLAVLTVAWSPDGTYLASAGEDRTVQVWQAATAERVYSYNQHDSEVCCIAWSPVRTCIASGSEDATVHIWSMKGGISPQVCRSHTRRVLSVAWSPDGESIISGSDDQTVKIWHAATAQLRSTFSHHTYAVAAVAWSPDGQWLASGSWDHTIRIWEGDRQEAGYMYGENLSWVTSLSWSPDSQRLVSGGWDTTAHIISLHRRK